MGWLKSFGRSLGINSGNEGKEEEAFQHGQNIRGLKGSAKKLYASLKKDALRGDMYWSTTDTHRDADDGQARKGWVPWAELKTWMKPNSKGELNPESYSSYTKFRKGQGMTEENAMNTALFTTLDNRMAKNKRAKLQEIGRAEKGQKSFSSAGEKKELKIERFKPKANESTASGKYAKAGKSGYNSLKLSGGSSY